MSHDELREALARIDERLAGHFDRYDRDREEAMKRIDAENRTKNEWRQGIETKVDYLKEQIEPVVKDHKRVMRASQVLGLGLMGGAATWIIKWVENHWK